VGGILITIEGVVSLLDPVHAQDLGTNVLLAIERAQIRLHVVVVDGFAG
jgi:hypothetical protein